MNHYYGIYRGICTTNNDPECSGRVKGIIPAVFGDHSAESGWALPCVPPVPAMATPSFSTYGYPVPGQGVWFAFEGGDINYPIWIGVWAPNQLGSD